MGLNETQYSSAAKITYSYDNNGNLVLMSDSTGITSYVYDELDRLISSTDSFDKTVKYSYDIVGNRIGLTYPSDSNNPERTALYSYDKANRLDKITDWDGRVWDYDTDGAGRIASLTYPNGTKKEQSYDTAGRLSSMSYLKSDEIEFLSFGYTRDGQGNPINIIEFGTLLSEDLSPTNIEYACDELNRLTYSQEPTEAYSYDNCSNLVSRTDNSSTIDFTYDNDNRLNSSSEPGVYTYDKNGNMTGRILNGTNTSFSYDYENRLVSQISDGSTVKHYYNGFGNRIARNDNGILTRYVLDYGREMSQVLCETDISGKIIAYYIHGPQIVGRIGADGSQRYYHTNHIGSVVALTDENETVTDRYAYTPFGILTDREGNTKNPFTFVGGLGVMEEADGLYFMRARFYDADVGRFLQKDPISNIVKLNLYTYSYNNPILFSDPSGLSAWYEVYNWTKEKVEQVIDPIVETIDKSLDWIDIQKEKIVRSLFGEKGVDIYKTYKIFKAFYNPLSLSGFRAATEDPYEQVPSPFQPSSDPRCEQMWCEWYYDWYDSQNSESGYQINDETSPDYIMRGINSNDINQRIK